MTLAQALRSLKFFRLRPFDTSTESGRAMERMRRVALTAVADFTAKFVTFATTLITVPLTVDYLGVERYGLWVTISTLVAMLAFADLGIGNGLLNAVAAASGKDDREQAARAVSSGFYILLLVAAVIGLGFAIAYPFVPWPKVFNLTGGLASREAGTGVAVFMALFLTNIPIGIVKRIHMGYQEGYVNSLWEAAGKVFGLLGLLLVIHLEGGLPWLVFALAGGPVLAMMGNGVTLFGARRPWLLPRPSNATRKDAKTVLGAGLLFFSIQVAVAIGYQSDNIILAQGRGAEAVADLAVPYRLFMFLPMFFGFVLMPLWPAYREAIARRDVAWVKKTFLRSLTFSIAIAAIPAAALVLLGPAILRLWVGPEIQPSFALLAGLGVWALIGCVNGTVAMFLNGAGILKFQAICAAFLTLGAVALKILTVVPYGGAGIVWSNIAAQTVFVLIPSAFYIPKVLRRIGTGEAAPDATEETPSL